MMLLMAIGRMIPIFSFAESFVQNGLPLRSLNEALHLGRLGTQTVLISEKSFVI